MPKIVPIIMCGGSGTRLWPLSRESLPKQFISLFDKQSTFQNVVSVLAQSSCFDDLIVLTNRDYRFLVSEQLEQAGVAGEIILEPVRRDSGPAVAVAAELAKKRGPDTIVAILAADHAIADPDEFASVLTRAAQAAETGHIVTIGINPNYPATGYGYIQKGAALNGSDVVCHVEQFVEKPDAVRAQDYVARGHLWNSGNFIFPADLMLEELEEFAPDIVSAARNAVALAKPDLQCLVLDETAFAAAPSLSIDYAVMEKTKRAAVIAADYGWSDVGTWSSVRGMAAKDSSGNAVIGDGVTVDCENVLVHSAQILTAAVGLKNVVVVTTPDSVLVIDEQQVGRVKEIVESLKQSQRSEATEHRRTMRPWGYYQSVDEGARHQVKRIVVKPGGRLSLQKHHHRAEHWIVVKGIAEVNLDGELRLVHENESIYVPIGSVHRLANPGKINLELIEVQTGSYLGEDDIIRLEDIYNRN